MFCTARSKHSTGMGWLQRIPSFLTLLIVGSAVFVQCSTFIISSSTSVGNYTKVNLMSNLQKYIAHEEIRLKVIANFSGHEEEVPLVKQRLSNLKSLEQEMKKNLTSPKQYKEKFHVHHPTTIFALLRDFLFAWEHKLTNKTLYGARAKEFLVTKDIGPLPSRRDLDRAASMVVIVQSMYNISSNDLFKGQVHGHQGEPLNSADCYEIGKAAVEDGFLDIGKEWLDLALKDIDLTKVQTKKLTFNIVDALRILAKILFQRKEKERALKLMETAVELDPDDEATYQEYMKHRFGRNVSPLLERNIKTGDSWRKKYFDMCGNSSGHAPAKSQVKRPTRPRLRCRVKMSRTVPYMGYKEEILSMSPYISVVLDFVSDREITAVQNATLYKIKEKVLPGEDPGTMWQFRGLSVKDAESPTIAAISRRVSDVTPVTLPTANDSWTNVIDYGLGGLVLPHGEQPMWFKTMSKWMQRGHRLLTALVYLTDVQLGGSHIFIAENITVAPRKGMALLWYSQRPSGLSEDSLVTATCPLAVGRNIVLEKSIWLSPNDVNSMCGKRITSTHFAVERAKTCAQGKCSPRKKD